MGSQFESYCMDFVQKVNDHVLYYVSNQTPTPLSVGYINDTLSVVLYICNLHGDIGTSVAAQLDEVHKALSQVLVGTVDNTYLDSAYDPRVFFT
jgi:hypothetical protein